MLILGHSFADHQAAIRRNPTPFLGRQYKPLEPQVVYSVHDANDELLMAIHKDPKRERVVHDLKGQLCQELAEVGMKFSSCQVQCGSKFKSVDIHRLVPATTASAKSPQKDVSGT